MATSPQTIDVRPAIKDDAAEIARIYNHYIRKGGVTFDLEEYPIERVTKMLESRQDDAWFVAGSPGRLIGWASARRFSDRPGYRFSCETAIYIDEQAFGSGVGDLLQKRIERHCRDVGLHHAVAKIVADNQRSLAFHYRYGYELVGTQKEIGRVDDQWVDIAILQRIF